MPKKSYINFKLTVDFFRDGIEDRDIGYYQKREDIPTKEDMLEILKDYWEATDIVISSYDPEEFKR